MLKTKRGRAIALFLLFNLSLLTVSLIYAGLVEESAANGEELIPCFFKNNLRFYCPGCGSSRALVALLHFDLIGALLLSPGLVTAFFIIVYLDIRVLIGIIKNDSKYLSLYSPKLLILLVSVIVLNFILKNLLLFAFRIDLIGDLMG